MILSANSRIKENRLDIKIGGTIKKDELEALYTDIRFCVADLHPGFIVVTDFTNCKLGHLSGIQVFTKIMKFLQEKLVGRVIRVTGERTIIFKQVLKISGSISGYPAEYCETLQEAELIINPEKKAQNS